MAELHVHLEGAPEPELKFRLAERNGVELAEQTGRGIEFGTVLSGYRSAIVRARREFGISAELILCFLRDYPAEYAMATLLEALPYKDWIIGVGLDSDERGNPPKKFAAVFERARRAGFLLTMHCDIDQDGSIEQIRQVLEDIGVDRIDHGTNIVEDERRTRWPRSRPRRRTRQELVPRLLAHSWTLGQVPARGR